MTEQVGDAELPEDQKGRHKLLMELRQQAYQRLCDTVYEEKGYTSDAVPYPETLEKFDLMDDQASDLLAGFGLGVEKRLLSN